MKQIELDEDYEDMEMPVVCNCGQLFDLTEGYGSNKSNKVICESCHGKEDLESKIDTLGADIQYLKEEIESNQSQLEEYEEELTTLNNKLNNL